MLDNEEKHEAQKPRGWILDSAPDCSDLRSCRTDYRSGVSRCSAKPAQVMPWILEVDNAKDLESGDAYGEFKTLDSEYAKAL